MSIIPKMLMLIGLPGCGKSTYAKELEKDGYNIHSSDVIRFKSNSPDINSPADNQRVFQTLHKQIKEDLKNGINCVYDATNMGRKQRKAFLDELKNISCEKTAVLFVTPVEVCKERNAGREGMAKVPDYVYDNMLKQFNVPDVSYEGFDNIKVRTYDEKFYLPDYDDLDDFKQENPHHLETLGKHMKDTADCVLKNPLYTTLSDTDRKLLYAAARYHDIGKIYTKGFVNSKGEPTKEAHYYGHDNVGAYMFLLMKMNALKNLDQGKVLRAANLINWHMTPHTVWKQSQKRFKNDRNLLDKDFVTMIDILYEADKEASKSIDKMEEEEEDFLEK